MSGHQEVEQNDAGSPLADEPDPLTAVGRAEHREALGSEHCLDELELERVVVDDDDLRPCPPSGVATTMAGRSGSLVG